MLKTVSHMCIFRYVDIYMQKVDELYSTIILNATWTMMPHYIRYVILCMSLAYIYLCDTKVSIFYYETLRKQQQQKFCFVNIRAPCTYLQSKVQVAKYLSPRDTKGKNIFMYICGVCGMAVSRPGEMDEEMCTRISEISDV